MNEPRNEREANEVWFPPRSTSASEYDAWRAKQHDAPDTMPMPEQGPQIAPEPGDDAKDGRGLRVAAMVVIGVLFAIMAVSMLAGGKP